MHFNTLADAVEGIGHAFPRNGFTFQDQRGSETFMAFPELDRETAWRAGALVALGLKRGDRLGIVLLEPRDFVLTFLAAVRVGVVPVPLAQPRFLGDQHTYRRELAAIIGSSAARLVIVSPELLDLLGDLRESVPTLERIIPVTALEGAEPPCVERPRPDEVAFLQYTSGSTRQPCGVAITHGALLSNIDAFMTGLRVDSRYDKALTWLPLFHDMGLIAFVLATLVWGTSTVLMPTSRFIKRPSTWLGSMNRHRATLTSAPNFAYALATKHASTADLQDWDLSCVRILACGAEPIRATTLSHFAAFFGERCKLNPNALVPSYGLAEATLVVAMKQPVDAPVQTHRVDRTMFEQFGVAQPPRTEDEARMLEHVSCGPPVAGTQIRIVDDRGQAVPPGVEGEIWVCGPSLAAGYFGQRAAPTVTWADGWLHTGDLGYVCDDELYVTGRSKDLIILNGRNYHPQIIEWAVEKIDGVRAGSAAAFSRPGVEGEEVVVVVETRTRDLGRIVAEVDMAVRAAILQRAADVVCVPRGSLPKTTSGKLKRSNLRRNYLETRLLGVRLDADR